MSKLSYLEVIKQRQGHSKERTKGRKKQPRLRKTGKINLGFVSPRIIMHSNKSNQPDASISQIYCSSFKYSSICFGHPFAHHQGLINCSSRLWFTVGKTNDTATTTFQTVNQRRLLQFISSWWWAKRMPETCWAVFERWAINLRDWCIRLVDLTGKVLVYFLFLLFFSSYLQLRRICPSMKSQEEINP